MNVFAVSDSNQRSPVLGSAGAVSATLTVAPPEAAAALTQAVPFHWSTCPLAGEVIVVSDKSLTVAFNPTVGVEPSPGVCVTEIPVPADNPET